MKEILFALAVGASFVSGAHADEWTESKRVVSGLPGVRTFGEIVRDGDYKAPLGNVTYREITSFDTVNSCLHGLTHYCD